MTHYANNEGKNACGASGNTTGLPSQVTCGMCMEIMRKPDPERYPGPWKMDDVYGIADANKNLVPWNVVASTVQDLRGKLRVLELLRIDEWERLQRSLEKGSDWGWSVSVAIAAIIDMLHDHQRPILDATYRKRD